VSLENYIRIAAERADLDGLTLWRTRDGKWQASARPRTTSGFSVVTGGDPILAMKTALVQASKSPEMFQDFIGFGADGPVGIEWKRLLEALYRNLRARGVVL
jgi:hypothetical protein